jgi:hypothetical protein
VVYFFYPETAYRSLEEMDSIFRKTKSIFGVVATAKREPHRYGKNGEILIDYEATEEHERRQSTADGRRGSVVSERSRTDLDSEKGTRVERETYREKHRGNPGGSASGGVL